MSDFEYVSLRKSESIGQGNNFGLEIRVALGRPLTEADSRAAYAASDLLEMALRTETLRLSPATSERRAQTRSEILGLFEEPIFVEEVPNGYCHDWCCSQSPWFIVTTKIGRIEIGWRKRVLSIDWSGSTQTQTAHELFPNEDVTKGDRSIHAWGIDKARQYIGVLMAATL